VRALIRLIWLKGGLVGPGTLPSQSPRPEARMPKEGKVHSGGQENQTTGRPHAKMEKYPSEKRLSFPCCVGRKAANGAKTNGPSPHARTKVYWFCGPILVQSGWVKKGEDLKNLINAVDFPGPVFCGKISDRFLIRKPVCEPENLRLRPMFEIVSRALPASRFVVSSDARARPNAFPRQGRRTANDRTFFSISSTSKDLRSRAETRKGSPARSKVAQGDPAPFDWGRNPK